MANFFADRRGPDKALSTLMSNQRRCSCGGLIFVSLVGIGRSPIYTTYRIKMSGCRLYLYSIKSASIIMQQLRIIARKADHVISSVALLIQIFHSDRTMITSWWRNVVTRNPHRTVSPPMDECKNMTANTDPTHSVIEFSIPKAPDVFLKESKEMCSKAVNNPSTRNHATYIMAETRRGRDKEVMMWFLPSSLNFRPI